MSWWGLTAPIALVAFYLFQRQQRSREQRPAATAATQSTNAAAAATAAPAPVRASKSASKRKAYKGEQLKMILVVRNDLGMGACSRRGMRERRGSSIVARLRLTAFVRGVCVYRQGQDVRSVLPCSRGRAAGDPHGEGRAVPGGARHAGALGGTPTARPAAVPGSIGASTHALCASACGTCLLPPSPCGRSMARRRSP